jgi:hypothetical protein
MGHRLLGLIQTIESQLDGLAAGHWFAQPSGSKYVSQQLVGTAEIGQPDQLCFAIGGGGVGQRLALADPRRAEQDEAGDGGPSFEGADVGVSVIVVDDREAVGVD